MNIGYKYKITEKIGNGNFGEIYKGINIHTGNPVAIKTELIHPNTNLLKHEAQIYQYIGIQKGFPQMKWFGSDKTHYYMVLDLFGETLSNNVDPILYSSVATQIIERIETLHSLKLIHRDIKPDNFLFGMGGGSHMLYLIDFGFCRSYLDNSGNHISMNTGKKMIGTPNYMSPHVKMGNEPSRRDDLISCVKVIQYMINSENVKIDELMKYGLSLDFDETPDYELCKKIVSEL